jgi:formamidopyrimidine-DNA glycosylase
LRVAIRGELEQLLRGQVFASVTRHAHFVRFCFRKPRGRGSRGLQHLELIVSPMLAGCFDLVESDAKIAADTALVVELDDSRKLIYRDNKQMGKVYVLPFEAHDKVPGFQRIGVDVLDEHAFCFDTFRALAKTRRDQVRVFLMDKTALDAMGNAYADEVLFAAGIHPKAWVRSLDDEALGRLHRSIVEVLSEARDIIAERAPPLPQKLRDFLKVRGRAGEPCPNCKTKIRRARVRGYDACFCPRCQPDGRKSTIVDWSRL